MTLFDPGQVRGSATQPPAVTEAPATTTAMPSAVPARQAGEETHATQVRPQDGGCSRFKEDNEQFLLGYKILHNFYIF